LGRTWFGWHRGDDTIATAAACSARGRASDESSQTQQGKQTGESAIDEHSGKGNLGSGLPIE